MGIKEWIKSKLGDAWTAELDTEFGKELGAGYVPKTVHAEALEKTKGLETQIAERDKQLTTLHESAKGDEDLQKQIDTLKADNEKIKADKDKELEEIKFGNVLESALGTLGAKYPKVLASQIDRNKLTRDGDKIIGLDDQLKPMRDAMPDLFNEAKKEDGPGAGGNPASEDGKGKPTPPSGQVIL